MADTASKIEAPTPAKRARLGSLRLSIAIVWLAWLGCAGTVGWIYRRPVMHPHFLPLTAFLALQILATLWSLWAGVRCIVSGPRRLRAVVWMAPAIVPGLLSAAPLGYGLWCSTHLRQNLSLPWLKAASAAGGPFVDAATRFYYPRRLAGKKCVMIFDKTPHPEADVAAMDRHIERLEGVLGRPCRTKAYWIRGGVFGFHGIGFIQGFTLGSDGGTEPDSEGLNRLDRHEVAHFVIWHQIDRHAEPPSVLSEGWAMAQEGHKPGELARDALRYRIAGPVVPLTVLFGPEWCGRSANAAYVQGGPLVDFMLREYGAEKFLELFSTCREKSLPEDCKRIVGVGLDELDRLYWADVRRQAAQWEEDREGYAKFRVRLPAADGEPDEMVPLYVSRAAAEKTEPAADVAARKAFLAEYPDALCTLTRAYDQVSFSGKMTMEARSGDGKETVQDTEIDYARNGLRQRSAMHSAKFSTVVVAAPEQSFLLRKDAGSRFYIPEDVSTGYLVGYRGYANQARFYAPHRWLFTFQPMSELMADRSFVIRDIAGIEAAGNRLVKVTFEKVGSQDQGSFVLDPQRGWALRDLTYQRQYGNRSVYASTCTLTYDDTRGSPPVLKAVRSRSEFIKGGKLNERVEIERVTFGPVDDRQFRLDAYPVK